MGKNYKIIRIDYDTRAIILPHYVEGELHRISVSIEKNQTDFLIHHVDDCAEQSGNIGRHNLAIDDFHKRLNIITNDGSTPLWRPMVSFDVFTKSHFGEDLIEEMINIFSSGGEVTK